MNVSKLALFCTMTLTLLAGHPAKAEKPVCDASMKPFQADVDLYKSDINPNKKNYQQLCKIELDNLHPTQFSVGMYEVHEKADAFRKMTNDDLKDDLNHNPEPIVIGPGGKMYIIDHHHLARSLYQMNADLKAKGKPVLLKHTYAIVIENKSDISSTTEFWNFMEKNNWAYPYNNKGIHSAPVTLEKVHTVMDLEDDPFRTLAGETRCKVKEDCTKKQWFKPANAAPFVEFLWAKVFRSMDEFKGLTELNEDNIKESLETAGAKVKELGGKLPKE